MPDLLMAGPQPIRHALCDWLQADLPLRIPRAREVWRLEEHELPLPMRYDPHEPLTLDKDVSPIVSVVSGRQVVKLSGDRSAAGDRQFTVTYPIRIFGWVRAEGIDATLDLRDRFLTVLQLAVLSAGTLREYGHGHLSLLPDVTVDFSGLDGGKGDRYLAGGYVGFPLRATETLGDRLAHTESPSGRTVASVHVTGSVLPPRPAVIRGESA